MNEGSVRDPRLAKGFHLLAKPAGPICNLGCKYCFYLEKEKFLDPASRFRMTGEVLENFVRQYIESHPGPEVNFAWQGGEPTLLGVEFFRRAVELQKEYTGTKRISNAIQTNGVLLDDEWGRFLSQENFLVGLSLDGPADLHDCYRTAKSGAPSFDRVLQGLEILKKHQVEFNTLTCVHRKNAEHPQRVYEFLKKAGARFLQFIPIVERRPDEKAAAIGLDLAYPPGLEGDEAASPVTPWSVRPKAFGQFLSDIFDRWVRHDVGRIFVQHFDVTLASWMGMDPPLCVFSERCGTALAIEHDGSLYSCDHYVYPEYHLGNIAERSLLEMIASGQQRKFGNDKADSLPRFCHECDVLALCHGGCPKQRFMATPDGEPGLNYLCAGYRQFFHHSAPLMKAMAELLHTGRPASMVMKIVSEREHPGKVTSIAPNSACPCGSGKKFKQCCGR